jgi:putative glutamine amidotransferase
LLTSPDDDPDGTLSLVDGLLLMGGGDVEPSRYGGGEHPQMYGVEPDRDAFEIALVHAADAAAIPTLAICRGIQVLNVAFGGSLHPHLPDVEAMGPHGPPLSGDPVLHDVKLTQGSRVAGAMSADLVYGASHHHQGIDRLGDGLVPIGWSQDGLIEAVEREDGWMVGVQWHPEETAATEPAHQGLFHALVRESAAVRP